MAEVFLKGLKIMGTDIHPIVQVRREGIWQNVAIPKDGRYGNILDHRHYDLFAILGNVRNGYGFGGVVTGSGFVPISDGRGLPEDFPVPDESFLLRCAKHRVALPAGGSSTSTELAVLDEGEDEDSIWDCEDCHWLGDHSHTWVTLRELNEYDWDAPVAKSGVMTARFADDRQRWGPSDLSYEEWMKSPDYLTKMPSSYAGGISGRNIQTVPEQEYVERLRAGTLDPRIEYVVSFARSITIRDIGGMSSFLADEGPLGWLRSLGEPDDVRIVMGFDS